MTGVGARDLPTGFLIQSQQSEIRHMRSPYSDLAPRHFWKTGVCEQDWSQASDLYKKKFDILPSTRIVTAGSCFAQHIARYLRARRYRVLDVEPPPPGLSADTATRFGYRLYSARYGNIYTVRQLVQLVREAAGRFKPANAIWEKDGRHYDALRPSVEPEGLDSPTEVLGQREDHLTRVTNALKRTDLFIFTFGLTEAWIHNETGTVYPTAPGVIAGEFDPDVYAFKNFTFGEIYRDFLVFRRILKRYSPQARILLTVSPVPLTATASGSHVLPATIYSKSVLRSVAGQLAAQFDDVDYFPSYEIIATPFTGNIYYESNLRSVQREGVDAVMSVFFGEHCKAQPDESQLSPRLVAAANARYDVRSNARRERARQEEDVVCEEVLLEAFAQR